MKNLFFKEFKKCTAVIILLLLFISIPAYSYPPEEKGMSAAELFRILGITATVIALIALIVVEFIIKKRLSRGTYKWILFFGLFMLPMITMMSSTSTLLEETKTVESCASCHNMEPFVSDMKNSDSPTLAARHFENKWIEKNQCYSCHTSYGVHGTLEAKRDGFRHWLLYVTDSWEEPITFKGTYPNSNCMSCHGGTPAFKSIDSHIALMEKLTTNEVNCSTCHGPVHPVPKEREPGNSESAKVIWEKQSREDLDAITAFITEIEIRNRLVNK